MRFKCPNCSVPVDIVAHESSDSNTLDEVICPWCQTQFSISGNDAPTQIPVHGLQIGRFEAREVLGEGAFGIVYRSWDPQLERFLAIKVSRGGRYRHKRSDDLLQEARNAARIRHPGVVQVLEVGSTGDEMYIASELIDGISLSQWLKSNRPSPSESARIVAKVCRAVEAAHAAGVIHRDLKPGNILLDTDGNPHVTDFGLSVRSHLSEMLLHAGGQILGTPSYMSPEQARADVKQIGLRTDIYALGVVLYELLTGRRPFVTTDSKTVLYRIQTEEPARPGSLNPAIPRDLERICLRAMQKRPEDRYASAADMADDLENFLHGFPIKARAGRPLYRLTKWISRNRTLTLVCLAVALLVGIPAAMYNQQPVATEELVPVVIETHPPATRIEFERYNEFLRVPVGDSAGISPEMSPEGVVRLTPGLYRVRAFAPEERFHEVWRYVPKPGKPPSLTHLFPHKSWQIESTGVVRLPGFRLFRDDEIGVPMVPINGGDFVFGNDAHSGFSEAHRRTVSDLLVGVNEVTEAEFLRVMSQTQMPDSNISYLENLDGIYGSDWRGVSDRPVTGYPRDVAILFCELAGGRLPDHVEWEYVASRGGQEDYSTGTSPPEIPLSSWEVHSVSADTPDLRMPYGVRGLCSNAAEYTDSVCVSYRILYPEHIRQPVEQGSDSDMLANLSRAFEVRGGDPDWIRNQPIKEAPSARTRATIFEVSQSDSDTPRNRLRIGWRMFRTRGPHADEGSSSTRQ